MAFRKLFSFALALLMLVPLCAVSASGDDGVISVGKSYTVEYATPIDNAYPKKAYSPETKLTDGETASKPLMNDKAWLALYRGTAVEVTIDLGEIMAVSSATLGQLSQKAAGIYCSRYLEIYVSENGTDFGLAGRTEDKISITQSAARRVELSVTLDKPYRARYVRAVFSSTTHTYVDEISVYGSGDISSAATAKTRTVAEKGLSGDIDGIKSVCLMYTASAYTTETIKPYFAYVDASGEVKDTMFDSLLFLGMPETNAEDGYMRQADMQNFVAAALDSETNIGALNTVVGELKDDLQLGDGYKYPIFFSVPDIGLYSDAFGTIDGSTVTSDSPESRSAIVKWYIDYVEQEFSECGYSNLELKGFYWFAEGINHSISPYESELVAAFNDYSHEKGYKTMWIPYYSSSGIDEAKDLGFDSVTMQAGHAFVQGSETGDANAEACYDAAATAKKFGLNGTEFEVDCNVKNYTARFAQYVSAAYGAGIMENGMITMYQVGDHLYRSSQGQFSREVYDLTYEFISGKYAEFAPVIEGDITVTVKAGEYVRSRFAVTDEDTNSAKLEVVGLQKIEGLYIEAFGNGRINIEAGNAVPGTYETPLAVTDGNNISNTVKLTIIVEPADGAENSDVFSDASGADGSDGGADMTVIIAVVIIAAVVIAAAVAVIKIRSSKKK